MTAHRHHLRSAGTCYTQGQQRCAAMRSVISVWNKTDAGNQN